MFQALGLVKLAGNCTPWARSCFCSSARFRLGWRFGGVEILAVVGVVEKPGRPALASGKPGFDAGDCPVIREAS